MNPENELRGIKIIAEMSRSELLEELMSYEREDYEKQETPTLKHEVIKRRSFNYHKRLHKEAGLEDGSECGFSG